MSLRGPRAQVTAGNLAARITGLLRVVAVGGALGTTYLGNTYQSANLVSNLLFELLAAGILSSVLVPPFVALIDEGKAEDAERLAGAVLGLALAVLGAGEGAAGEALFLRTYTEDLTLVTMDGPLGIGPEDRERLDAAGIRVVETPLRGMEARPGEVDLHFADGSFLSFDTVYSGLGVEPRTGIAEPLGPEMTSDRRFVTDPKQRSSVPGLYAAGDAVTGLNQIAVAMAQAEIAAVDLHNALRRNERMTLCA